VQPDAGVNQPVFGTNSAGRITLRGVPGDQIKAVRDKLKLKDVIIGRDNAVFPKGTDIAALKAEFGVAEPKKATQKPAAQSLIARIRQLGGVNISHVKDITGESNVRNTGMVGVFSKTGKGLDGRLGRAPAMPRMDARAEHAGRRGIPHRRE